MKLALVAGARPNFIKIAPLVWELRRRRLTPLVIHTGQHYDPGMSDVFFRELDLPAPDFNLGVGSGSHGQQTARVISAIEPVLQSERPDWLLVVGDVNSTLAAALAGVKLGVRVGHVEAGLRSGDRKMPEEINRLATDSICHLLLAPSQDAVQNLRNEGHPESRIAFSGNVMVDTLLATLPRIQPQARRERMGVPQDYVLVTLHRPSNVDSDRKLGRYLSVLARVAEWLPVVFPVHPRVHARLEELLPSAQRPAGFKVLPPAGYADFLSLEEGATAVMTDSGGVQEETTVLGVPCLTTRDTTERPVTVTHGTNRVVGSDPDAVEPALRELLDEKPDTTPARPPGWDGQAAERIVSAIEMSDWPATEPLRVGREPDLRGIAHRRALPSDA